MAELTRGGLVGRSVARVEDRALLTGRARFVGDLRLPRMLHAAFARSPHPHARLLDLDLAPALAVRGVVAAFGAAELPHRPLVDAVQVPGLERTPQPAMVEHTARHVGEPVAIVLAESAFAAHDGAAAVTARWDELAPLPDVDRARAAGAPLLHAELSSNVVYRGELRAGAPDEAFAAAHHVSSIRFHNGRALASPLEPRGCLAEPAPEADGATVWSSTQGPHLLRRRLHQATGLMEGRLRVVSPSVGGGFGVKIPAAPEEVAVLLAALATGRPVRWIEERGEHLVAAPHAKEQWLELELALDAGGRFLGLRGATVGDAGAYSFNAASALIEPYLSAGLMPGPYRIEHVAIGVEAVLTTKAPIAPYRGVGWTAGHTARELLVDRAARELGRDPVDLRRANLVSDDDFPHVTALGMVYDSGAYRANLDDAVSLLDASDAADAAAPGCLVGVGVSPYVEPAGWGSEGSGQSHWSFASHDAVRLSIGTGGDVVAAVGTNSQGQGHATTLAQVVADELGVPLEAIVVRAQDTDGTPISTAGTRASRTAVVTGGALALAARDLRERVRAVAAHRLGRPAETLDLRDGRVVDTDGGDAGLDLRAVAETAFFDPTVRAVMPEPELSVTRFYDPPATYSSGCIACVAEVDPGTGRARVLRLAAIEDCGTMINPTIVEGQLLGALAQGVGMALFESAGYDAEGRPTARTLTDYRLPRATDVPEPRLGHRESPSPWTVNGVKGMGESGAIAAPAAVACAVADALAPLGAAVERTPLTPATILAAIREGGGAGP